MFCQPQRIGDYFADPPGEPQAVYGKFGDPLRPFPTSQLFWEFEGTSLLPLGMSTPNLP
jgi:hypothetical protein